MSAVDQAHPYPEHITIRQMRRRATWLGPHAARALAKRLGGIRIGRQLLVRADAFEKALREGDRPVGSSTTTTT
jgi:hypothetical protein